MVRPHHHLRHDAPRRRAGARILVERSPRSCSSRAQLDALGVDVIEAGFPIASEADAEAVRTVATEVRRPVVAALARCRRDDIDRAGAVASRRPRVAASTPSSPPPTSTSRASCTSRARRVSRRPWPVSRRRGATPTMCSSRRRTRRGATSISSAASIEAVIDAGATTINLPDTVGYATPDEIATFFTTVLGRVPNAGRAVFSAHCHDDLGLAVANSLAAVQAGVRQVECTINGIGERAGNASLEEIVMATRVRSRSPAFRHRHRDARAATRPASC